MNDVYFKIFRLLFVAVLTLATPKIHAQIDLNYRLLSPESPYLNTTKLTTPKPHLSPKAASYPTSVLAIPKAYCYAELAPFCKLEVQLERRFKFPIKIRLGEVNYVEMLEGKPFTPDIH